MKKDYYIFILIAVTLFITCNQSTQKDNKDQAEKNAPLLSTGIFGDSISPDNAIIAEELLALLQENDTIEVKVTGDIVAACQHSGCWMDIGMGYNEVLKVTFKDYAFFIPKDAAGKKAVLEGIAFRELVPVETLRHYAEDEGKSEEEIAAITMPEMSYLFVAKGVIIK